MGIVIFPLTMSPRPIREQDMLPFLSDRIDQLEPTRLNEVEPRNIHTRPPSSLAVPLHTADNGSVQNLEKSTQHSFAAMES
jgi:hypothetical protein